MIKRHIRAWHIIDNELATLQKHYGEDVPVCIVVTVGIVSKAQGISRTQARNVLNWLSDNGYATTKLAPNPDGFITRYWYISIDGVKWYKNSGLVRPLGWHYYADKMLDYGFLLGADNG